MIDFNRWGHPIVVGPPYHKNWLRLRFPKLVSINGMQERAYERAMGRV